MKKMIPVSIPAEALKLNFPRHLEEFTNPQDQFEIAQIGASLYTTARLFLPMLYKKFAEYPDFKCNMHVVLDAFGLSSYPCIVVGTNVFAGPICLGASVDYKKVRAWWGFTSQQIWQKKLSEIIPSHIEEDLAALMEPVSSALPWRIVSPLSAGPVRLYHATPRL